MNKTALTAIILLTLLIAVVAGTQVVEVAGAPTPHGTYYPGDPYTTIYVPTEIQPSNGTKPPIVTITSPINNTVIALDNLTLTFNLTLDASNSFYLITWKQCITSQVGNQTTLHLKLIHITNL